MWAKIGQMVITSVITLLAEKIPQWIAAGFKYVKDKAARKKRDQANQDAANRSAEAQTPEEARRVGDELP